MGLFCRQKTSYFKSSTYNFCNIMLIFRDFCEFSSTSKTFQLIIFTFLFDFFCSMSLTSPRSLSFSFLFQNKSNQALLW